MLNISGTFEAQTVRPQFTYRRRNGLFNAIDHSSHPSKEKNAFYTVVVLQILFVLPFPAYVFYYMQKPKYIIPLFFIAAVCQVYPAIMKSKNKAIVLFCLCGSLLMLFEVAVYSLLINV